jgi:hypothetical protein
MVDLIGVKNLTLLCTKLRENWLAAKWESLIAEIEWLLRKLDVK